LKLDGCNVDTDQMSTGYPEMERYLNKTGRPIIYSCSWPAYLLDQPTAPNYTAIGLWCNLWRNYDDISANWKSIQSIIDWYSKNQDILIPAHGPGKWNDPDMIVVGEPTITVDQAKTQMSIWSIWSAPLIMSNDLRMIAPVFKDILQNARVIAVDQDALGIMGRMIINTTTISVYVKAITPVDSVTKQTSFAVVFFNRQLTKQVTAQMSLRDMGLINPTGYFVRELWTDAHYGLMGPDDLFVAHVNPTGVVMIRADIVESRMQQQKAVDDY